MLQVPCPHIERNLRLKRSVENVDMSTYRSFAPKFLSQRRVAMRAKHTLCLHT